MKKLYKNKRSYKIISFIVLFIILNLKLVSQTYLNMGLYQDYPEINNIFAVYDRDGNFVSNLKKEDVIVKENGIQRTIKSLSCGYNDDKVTLSAVMTIDVSGSMANGGDTTRMDIVKKAADAFVNGLDFSIDESAITSFDHRAFINQDFTTNKQNLIDAIDGLKPLGGTSYDEGFYGTNGGLTIIEKGKTGNKRILIFVTDGESKVDTTKVKQLAATTGTQIFTITIGLNMPKSLKRLAEHTGGLYFDNMKTISDVVGAFNYILQHVKSNGTAGCGMIWESDVVCNPKVEVSIEIPSLNIKYSTSYNRPLNLIPNLTAIPTSLKYGDVVPGNTKDLTTIITANGLDIKVDSSTISSKFTVTNWGGTAPPFTLTKGSTRTITVRFTPTDSNNVIGNLSLFNDGCKTLSFTLSGGKSGAIKLEGERTLKVISPNGGEIYSTCDSLLIEWEGIAETDTVEIRYSSNNGQSWNLITEKHWGSNKYWWKHNGVITSDKLLISVEQLGIMVYETNLIDAQNPSLVQKAIQHPSDTTKILFGFHSYASNYILNQSTKTYSFAGTISNQSSYNKNGAENYWVWGGNISSHNTNDGSQKFGKSYQWMSLTSVTPDYYNNRVIVGDNVSGKLYILNESNFNLIDSLEFHDSAPFEYNFTKDKKLMISSAQNEAILWDMTTYDTLKIFRNTGGFAYYFNVKDENKIHYIKDNKMNTYTISSGNVTSYNIKSTQPGLRNSTPVSTIATMADGENIIFAELLGGIDGTNYLTDRDFVGVKVYKTNINTQAITPICGNNSFHVYTSLTITKSHTSNEAYITMLNGRPLFYKYNNISNTYDSLNFIAEQFAHPSLLNLGYDANSIYTYGGYNGSDNYLKKIDRKTNKLIAEYGGIRGLNDMVSFDSGKKITSGGQFYYNVIDSSMNFMERRNENDFQAYHKQNLGSLKNNFTFGSFTNKLQSRVNTNTVEQEYNIDFTYDSPGNGVNGHRITTLKDGSIVVAASDNTAKFIDLYIFKENSPNPIASKRLNNYTLNNSTNYWLTSGGDFIALRSESVDYGHVYEIYDLELNIIKQFKDANTVNNYFAISSNGKYIYKYHNDKNIRVERLDNGKIMKNYNFANGTISSNSFISDDLNYAGFYVDDETQAIGKRSRIGVFYLGIPYLQADTSDAVFEIAKPVIAKTSPLNIGTVAIGKNKDANFSSVICNNSKFDLELDSTFMKSNLKIKLISNVEKLVLKPGECVDLEFNYTPTIVESVSDTLISYIGCDTIKVAILANSANPSIQVLNNIIDFKNVAVDRTKDSINAITIKNSSATPITINTVTIEGPDKTQFSILSGGGTFTIPAGQEHKMNFRFAPTKIGRTNTRLEFAYTGVGSPAEMILLGNGYGSPRAVIRDTSVFDSLKCGRLSQDTILTIRNTGSANLVLNSFTLSPSQHFFISDFTLPKTIAIGDSSTFKLKYEPFASGKHISNLTVKSNDTINYPNGNLNFYMSGVKDSVNIKFDKTILDFGITQFPLQKDIIVTNNGSTDINVSDIQLDQSQFKIINPLPPFVISAGNSETITIEFTPIDTISVIGRVTLAGEPCVNLEANLLGGGGTPIIQIQDDFAFDPNDCNNQTVNSKVYIWNMGNLDLEIDSIYIDGVDKNEFEIVYPINKISIEPRKNDSIIVRFKNRVYGERTAKVNVISNSVTGELNELDLKAQKFLYSNKSNVDVIDYGVTQVTKIDSFYVYNDGELDFILTKKLINQPQFKIIEPNLPYALKVGDTLWVKVEFTPQDTLSLVADLILSADDCPSVNLSLLGGSGTPKIRTIEFLEIKESTCESKDSLITIEYWNMGNLPLEVYEIKLTGTNADQFRVNLNFTGTEIIQARSKSTFELVFKAGDIGRFLAQVVITTNSVEGDKFISLIGERKSLEIEAFGFTDITDYIIDYGAVSIPTTKSFYINNKGSVPLLFDKVEFTNTKFEIIEPIVPFYLPSNVITEIKVRYNATSPEGEVGVLSLIGNPCGEIIVDLVSGIDSPTLKNTPEKIDFVLNGCNAQASQDTTIYLWNLGNSDLDISKISIIGQNANQYKIIYPTQSLNLKAKGKDSLIVRYAPTINGNSTAKILIENNTPEGNKEITLTGQKLKGELKFKPTFLDYGITQTPITLKTEVENSGDFDIVIDNYTINQTQFTVANLSTPFTLKPKEIITVFIEFNPTDTNSIVGKLTLNTNGCGEIVLNLIGGGGTPVIETIETLNLSAINCNVNNPIDTTFQIWNMGTLPLIISNITINDNGSGHSNKFEILSQTTNITILPRLSSTITLRYLNDEVGEFLADLLIESNSVEGDLIIPIKANTLNSSLIIDRQNVDYGLVQTSKNEKITITNNGNINLTISNITIIGVDVSSDGVFYVENITTPFDLQPNQSQELVIAFNPKDTLSKMANLTIDALPCGNLTAVLLGGGGTPNIQSIKDLEFVINSCKNDSIVKLFTLWNMGSLPLEISDILLENNSNEFKINLPIAPLTVAARGKTEFEIEFFTNNSGEINDKIIIKSNANDGDYTINLTGQKYSNTITLDNNNLDFGSLGTPPFDSKELSISIINNTEIEQIIYEPIFLDSRFRLVSPIFPLKLKSLESVKLTIVAISNLLDTSKSVTSEVIIRTENCGDLLANLSYNRANGSAEFVIGKGEEIPNKEITIPITLVSGSNLNSPLLEYFETEIEFNATMLYPMSVTLGEIISYQINNGIGLIKLKFPPKTEINTEVTSIKFKTLLGNKVLTGLKALNYKSIGEDIAVNFEDGEFNSMGICYADGARLINPYGIINLGIARPNPVTDVAFVDLELIEKDHTKLTLYSSTGVKLETLFDEIAEKGVKSFSINAQNLSTGVYYLILETPTYSQTSKFEIVK